MLEKLSITLATLILVAGVMYQLQNPRVVKKDCQWAEISPDFSPQEREQCRKMRK